ncbi:MAG: hypothetical protein ACM3NT_04920 [Methylocystaceae bacterium]
MAQDLMDMMNQVIAAASGPNAGNLNTLAGTMALLNLYGIVNYLNGGNTTVPISAPGGGFSGPGMPGGLNPDMLTNLMSMLGGAMPGAGTGPQAGNTGGTNPGMPGGLNPEMLTNLMSMLSGVMPGAGTGSPAGNAGAASGMPGGLNPEMLIKMMSMFSGAMPGAGVGAPPGNAGTASGMPGGLNPDMLMKMMSMFSGAMPGAGAGAPAGNAGTASGLPGGLNPDMLIKMMSMFTNQGGASNNPSGLPGPLANLTPEMITGLISMLGNMGMGRPAPPPRGSRPSVNTEGDDSEHPFSDDSGDIPDSSAMNSQMMLMLMNLLSSMNQNPVQGAKAMNTPGGMSASSPVINIE